MAYKTKSGYYCVSYRSVDGKSKTKSFGKGRSGKQKAEAFENEIKYKKSNNQQIPLSKKEGEYFDDICHDFIATKKAEGKNARWIKELSQLLNKNFIAPLSRKPAHLITSSQIFDIINEHYSNCSQTTKNKYIIYLKAIFSYAVKNKMLTENPLKNWKCQKTQRRVSPLTINDLRKIQETARLNVRANHIDWIIECSWNIPVRPGVDLFSLKVEHINFDEKYINVYHSKVKKHGKIYLNDNFINKCYDLKDGFLITYKNKQVIKINKSLKNMCKKAKLSYSICMYDIRHLWITTAINKGIELSTIAIICGTSVDMLVQNYYESHSASKKAVASIMPNIDEKVENFLCAKNLC